MAMTAPLAPPMTASAAKPISTARLLGLVLPMAIAMYGAFQGGQFVLLPIQLQGLDARNKVFNLAVIVMGTAVSGALGMVGGGWATDVTRSRWGGRAPWMLAMAALSALLFLALGLQSSVPVVGALAVAFWFTTNFFQGVMLTVLTARTRERDRAFALALFAVAGPIGGLYGYNLAALVVGAAGYATLGAVFFALTLAFVTLAPEIDVPRLAPAKPAEPRQAARPDTAFASFRRRDFLLAFVFRLAIFAGQATVMNYLVYYLIDRIGLAALPSHSAEISAGQATSLRTLFTLIGLGLGMALVRRTSRRKIFLQVYALGMGAAMLAPVFEPSWRAVLAYSALGGLAWGLYSTVDLMLMNAVLPNPATKGRDLGMLAMAGALAQLIGPPLASALIDFVNYSALFEVGAIITLAGGLAAGFLKSVR